MNYVVSFLAMAIKFATVFLFGATGEIINQKSGHLNMGTPGIMYMGALGGIVGERIYLDSIPANAALNPFLIVFIPILFAILFGAFGGALFSFFTVTLFVWLFTSKVSFSRFRLLSVALNTLDTSVNSSPS